MKTIIALMLLICANAYASELCFTMTEPEELHSLPEQICLKDVKANINPFSKSYVTLKLNDVAKKYAVKRITPVFDDYRNDESLMLQIDLFSNETRAGACDTYFSVDLGMSLTVSSKGELLSVDSIKGASHYSYDPCHSEMHSQIIRYSQD